MFSTLHAGLANTATLFTLALALWGLFRFIRGEGVGGSYLGALVVGELLIVVQALMGVALYAGGARAGNDAMHILYGICTLIAFPAFFAYLGGRDSRREMLLWALLAFFVFGLTLRARVVAG